MDLSERRSCSQSRQRLENITCFCKIELTNGFIGLEGKVIDVSSNGIRIQLSYQPSILDVIHIMPHFVFDGSVPSNDVEVVVKWSSELGEGNSDVFEVGCEIRNSRVDLKSCIEDWNINYCI